MSYQLSGNAWNAFNNQYTKQNLQNYLDSTNFLGISKANNPFSKVNIGGTMTTLAPAAGTLVGGIIGGGYESGAGNFLNGVGDIASALPGGEFIGAGAKVLGGITNALFGSKVDQAKLNAANEGTAMYNNFTSNATNFDDIQGPVAQANVQNAYSGGIFNKGSARRKNEALKAARREARQFAFNAVDNNVNNLQDDQMNNALAEYFAFGGSLLSKNRRKSHLFELGGGLGINDLNEDMQELSTGNQPSVDAAKQAGYGFNVDDYYYRAQKEHPDITRDQVIQTYTTTPVVASAKNSGITMAKYATDENNPQNDRVMMYTNTIDRDIARRKSSGDIGGSTIQDMIGHEFGHVYKDKLYNGTLTDNENSELITAYGPLLPGLDNEELLSINRELRSNISRMNNNAVEENLDKAIDKISDNELMYQLFNMSGYTRKGKSNKGTMTLPNGKYDPSKVKNIRKALKDVAYNPVLQMDDINFAAFGGPLHSNGGDWTNGITIIGNGGTHENNPFEGVQMGIDEEGIPNLVEEGEVVFNDYVFSNRIKVPKAVREKYKLRGVKDMTFAEAAKKVQKESEERPNDPISKRSLNDIMGKLMFEQEDIRQKRAERKLKKYALGGLFAYGGAKGNRFDIGGAKLTPYAYSNDWSDFQWRTDDGYDEGYLDFTKSINQDWVNRILNGTYGDMSRYNKGNKGKAITPAQVGALASDGKYSDMHRAMGAAYMDYLRGMDPVTGEVPEMPTLASTSSVKLAKDDDIQNIELPEVTITPTPDTGNGKNRSEDKGEDKPEKTWLRYAPVVGAGIGLMQGLLSKPDYSNADMILNAARGAGNYRQVGFNPIGNYLRYTPFDRLFYANQLGAQAGATRRNIMNTSGGNRGAAMAGLLASDYNAQTQLGNLYRQAEEYNAAQREKVATFNRGTNMFNSEGFLKADIANQEAAAKASAASLSGIAQGARLRESIDQARGASISANLTKLFDNLGNIGWEAYNRNMLRSNKGLYYGAGRNGWGYYKGKDEEGSAFGGPLTYKRKRRK